MMQDDTEPIWVRFPDNRRQYRYRHASHYGRHYWMPDDIQSHTLRTFWLTWQDLGLRLPDENTGLVMGFGRNRDRLPAWEKVCVESVELPTGAIVMSASETSDRKAARVQRLAQVSV